MTDERPLFQHPPWMVGIMLILGVMSLLVGLTVDPFWLVIGSPTILTLVVYIGVRVALFVRFRRPSTSTGRVAGEPGRGEDPDWVSQDEHRDPAPGSSNAPRR